MKFIGISESLPQTKRIKLWIIMERIVSNKASNIHQAVGLSAVSLALGQ